MIYMLPMLPTLIDRFWIIYDLEALYEVRLEIKQ